MRRVLASILCAGVMVPVPALSAADSGSRGKLRPVTVAVFMRDEGDDACDPISFNLRFVDGPDVESCGHNANGAGNEVLENTSSVTGQRGFALTWYMPGRVNFVLDATKDIKGKFWLSGGGGGMPTLQVTIRGLTRGEMTVIGEGEVSYTATPCCPQAPIDEPISAEITITPDKSLHTKRFTGLELITLVRGYSARHGFFWLDDPPSHFTMSILTPGGKLPKGATPPPSGG